MIIHDNIVIINVDFGHSLIIDLWCDGRSLFQIPGTRSYGLRMPQICSVAAVTQSTHCRSLSFLQFSYIHLLYS